MSRFPLACLMALLVLLQLMAPLLHAHSGADASPDGLHLPGLERFDRTPGPNQASIVRYELESEHGIIVGIAHGASERPTLKHLDGDPSIPSDRLPPPRAPCRRVTAIHPIPAPVPAISRFSPTVPRAPPAHHTVSL